MILELITAVFGSLALLMVILRMVTRMPPFKASFGWDDALILAVMVTSLFATSCLWLTMDSYLRSFLRLLISLVSATVYYSRSMS
jgi:hypothetical protein